MGNSEYAPGSICNLQPRTSAGEVDEFLAITDYENEADKLVHVRSLIPGEFAPGFGLCMLMRRLDQPLPSHLPPSDITTTLRSLFTNHLNLRSSPRKSFFEWLRRLSPDEREQERLDDFITNPVSTLYVSRALGLNTVR